MGPKAYAIIYLYIKEVPGAMGGKGRGGQVGQYNRIARAVAPAQLYTKGEQGGGGHGGAKGGGGGGVSGAQVEGQLQYSVPVP